MAQCLKTIINYPYWPKFRDNLSRYYTTSFDKWVLGSFLATLMCAILVKLIDYFFWHFVIVGVSKTWVALLPIYMSLGFCSVALADRFPRTSLVGVSLFLSYWVAISQLLYVGAVIDTPFSLVDHWLLQGNIFFHLNTVALLIWVHQHNFFHQILLLAYSSWTYQLIFFPLVFAFLKEKHVMMRFYCGIIIIFFVGGVIYFFFPSNGPASVLHSPLFPHMSALVAPMFSAVHLVGPDPVKGCIGVISMPSFHVIGSLWLCFMISCLAKRKLRVVRSTWGVALIILLWAMVLLLNVLLIASTILLGWHYILDDVVSVVMVVVVYAATSPHYKKLCAVSGN